MLQLDKNSKQDKYTVNKKPPQGFYFGHKESFLEDSIKSIKENPGVGRYNIDENTGIKSKIQVKTSALPQAKRFQDPPESTLTPSPQHYIGNNSIMLSTDCTSSIMMDQSSGKKMLKKSNSSTSSFDGPQRRTGMEKHLKSSSNDLGPGQYHLPELFGKSNSHQAPKFDWYTRRTISLTDEGVPGVGMYQLKSTLDKQGAVIGQQQRDIVGQFYSKSQKMVPGVGKYYSEEQSQFKGRGEKCKGAIISKFDRFNGSNSAFNLKEGNPGVGQYEVKQEDQFKYKNNRGYTIQKYHKPGVSIEEEFDPSPFDYCDRVDAYNKPVTFEKSNRPEPDKMNKNPGVGQYSVGTNLLKEKKFERFEINNPSKILESILLTRRSNNESTLLEGDTVLESYQKKAEYAKQQFEFYQKKVKYLGEKQNLDEKTIDKYLEKQLSYREVESIFQPGSLTYDISHSGINSFAKTEDFQGKSKRKLEYLDVFNIPAFSNRSKGPSGYMQPNNKMELKNEKFTIPQSKKIGFITPPKIKPGVGSYQHTEFSLFGKYSKQKEKLEEFKKREFQKKNYVLNLEIEKQKQEQEMKLKKQREKEQQLLKKHQQQQQQSQQQQQQQQEQEHDMLQNSQSQNGSGNINNSNNGNQGQQQQQQTLNTNNNQQQLLGQNQSSSFQNLQSSQQLLSADRDI